MVRPAVVTALLLLPSFAAGRRHASQPPFRHSLGGVGSNCSARAGEVAALTKCLTDGVTGVRSCFEPEIQFCPSSMAHGSRWPVYLEPPDTNISGWRFFHLITQVRASGGSAAGGGGGGGVCHATRDQSASHETRG